MLSNTQLVQFQTPDGLLLPGLLFELVKRTRSVALYIHGCGGSSAFYSVEKTNDMAAALAARGIAYFSFNNRGAHTVMGVKRIRGHKEERVLYGTAYERIKECIRDIDGAITFLRKQGYRTFYLIGHSTGANKICVYNYYRPKNAVAKYVLFGGGDDVGDYYARLGRKKFFSVLQTSKRMVRRGKGREIAPRDVAPYEMSYQSLYNTMNPDGDYNVFPFIQALRGVKLSRKQLFRHYRSIKKPTLVLYGSEDEYCSGPAAKAIDVLQKECAAPARFTFKLVKGADHGFTGRLQELATLVARWLAK